MIPFYTPNQLGLDFADWRPGQWDAIVQAVESPAEYVVIEAPTGAGKSVIALGIGRLMEARKLMVLTGTKQLQEQYLRTSSRMREVKGRGNFPCLIKPQLTADDGQCTYGKPCEYYGKNGAPGCAYFDQKKEAQRAAEVVTNYAYMLRDFNYSHTFEQPRVLVCDEAHTIEEQLASFVTVTLREAWLDEFHLRWPGLKPADWEGWKAWAGRVKVPMPHSGTLRWKHANTLAHNLKLLAENLDEDWLLRPTRRGIGMEFRPVWIHGLAEPYLLRHGRKKIFLSATIRPLALFCQSLGIREEDTHFIEMPSTFPVEQRPLYYQPVGRVKVGDLDVMRRLVDRVDDILENHVGEKGLIHTVNYRIRDFLFEHSRYPERLVTHHYDNRAAVIDHFKRWDTPVALVSPSVGTGVDLPYDECRFNIICKLPFPDKGDEQVQRRMKVGPDGQTNARGESWYAWATSCSLIQSYGRGMRAEDDRAASYLLDGNWDWFKHAAREMFPPWFLEALVTERREGQRRISIDDYVQPSTTTPIPTRRHNERIIRL